MNLPTIQLVQKDFDKVGKILSLVDVLCLLINERMEVEYINDIAKKTLKIDLRSLENRRNFFQVWSCANLTPIIDENGNLLPAAIFLIKNSFLQWHKVNVLIKKENVFFLLEKKPIQQLIFSKKLRKHCKVKLAMCHKEKAL